MLKKIEKISLLCLLTWRCDELSLARTTPVSNMFSWFPRCSNHWSTTVPFSNQWRIKAAKEKRGVPHMFWSRNSVPLTLLLWLLDYGKSFLWQFSQNWYTVKPVLVSTSIDQATCIKQACIQLPKQANVLKCTCIKQAPVLSKQILIVP